MVTVKREVLEDVVYRSDMDLDQIRSDYSGRGMYGRECLGLTCTLPDLLMFAINFELIHGDDEDADLLPSEWIPQVQEDSMGRGAIYYWPSVQVVD